MSGRKEGCALEIGIIGLSKSGKTTVFNSLTGGGAQVAAYGEAQATSNLGVAKIDDRRLAPLKDMFQAARLVPVEITYIDVPGTPPGLGHGRGISGEFLNQLQMTDALLIVARAFDDPAVPHGEDTVDCFRDIETMRLEMTLADLEILQRRMTRLADGHKGVKAPEREAMDRERALMERLSAGLEEGTPIHDQPRSPDEARLLDGFQLLTAKPLVLVVNVGEELSAELPSIADRLASEYGERRFGTLALCGKLEMELMEIDPEDRGELRSSLGLEGYGANRVDTAVYRVLDMVTFFTGNDKEVRAWAVVGGTTAVKAAGRVHSDFERGFIRSEVIGADDLVGCGSFAAARKKGLLRQEGKTYTVHDGDVMQILFNV